MAEILKDNIQNFFKKQSMNIFMLLKFYLPNEIALKCLKTIFEIGEHPIKALKTHLSWKHIKIFLDIISCQLNQI